MAFKTPKFPRDANGTPIPVFQLSDSHDVNGTAESQQSDAIEGSFVRIVSVDNALRVKIAANPVAEDDDILIPALGELWLPITDGFKVAVKGGKANICTAH